MKTDKTSRRRLLAGMAGVLGASTFASKTAAAVLTPSASEGPFYPLPSMRTPDIDNDLVKITGLVQGAGGEVFTLRGTITNRDGHPRVGHRIEIWQCDLDGNYQHPNDPRSANFDPAFQGFGHDITDQNGAYVFRTIKPEVYPGRTPHIHVKIFDGASELLTTQIYVKGDSGNPHDSLFKRMSKGPRRRRFNGICKRRDRPRSDDQHHHLTLPVGHDFHRNSKNFKTRDKSHCGAHYRDLV